MDHFSSELPDPQQILDEHSRTCEFRAWLITTYPKGELPSDHDLALLHGTWQRP